MDNPYGADWPADSGVFLRASGRRGGSASAQTANLGPMGTKFLTRITLADINEAISLALQFYLVGLISCLIIWRNYLK